MLSQITSFKNLYKLSCLLTILVVVFIRIHLANIPFERDEGEYAYAGQLILQGTPPYQEMYNMKFPGVYYMYAISFKIFGQQIYSPRYLVLILQLIGAGFIFFAARLVIHPLAGWMAAAFFMLFSTAIPISGCQSNAEHFLVMFLAGSMFFIYRGTSRHSVKDMFIAGLLIAMACIMKQHAFIFIFAAGLWAIYTLGVKAFKYLVYYAIGGLIPAILMCLYLWHAGVWSKFYFLTIQYAREYVGMGTYDGIKTTIHGIYKGIDYKSAVLLVSALIGVLGILVPRSNVRTQVFIILFLIASAIAVTPGFYFRGHYFLIMVPPVTLLLADTVFLLADYFKPLTQNIFLWLFTLIGAVSILNSQKAVYFKLNNNQVIEHMYPHTPFVMAGKIAGYIRQRSTPGDRICLVGAEPEIFFLSNRRSASGYIYVYPLLEKQKYAAAMTDEFIAESEKRKPLFLLYSSQSVFDDSSHFDSKLYQWYNGFRKNYQLVAMYYAQKGDMMPVCITDTIAPADTLAADIAQVKIYQRTNR